MVQADANRALVILDRDGVINKDSPDFVRSAAEWIPLDGSIEAVAALSKAGFDVAVASNQSGLARGLFNNETLTAMHDKMRDLVAAAGGHIAFVAICPHGPDDACDCRKPRPGLLQQIGAHFRAPLTGVPAIGDSLRDLEAARAAGARPILVRSGNGQRTAASLPSAFVDVEIYDDLAAAASALIKEHELA